MKRLAALAVLGATALFPAARPLQAQEPRPTEEPLAPADFQATALQADPTAGGSSDGNGVLEPGETVQLAPSWRNQLTIPTTVSGALSAFTGPGAPSTYSITDAAAAYGTVPANTVRSCRDAGDCYALALSNGARPSRHWDASAFETLTTGSLKGWAIHVGDSFADVPRASPYYRFIEAALHAGVTGGCSPTQYCPGSPTTREQMATFVLVSQEGSFFLPRGCVQGTERFSDVPYSSPFCPWIEELARRGVVSGCGGSNYCPGAGVSRDQMAVFALLTREGGSYTPPPCTAGSEVFGDVPAANPFCKWIEELARRGVVGGCGGGNYCPGAVVTRDQMSVFLSGTFQLSLYGPLPNFYTVTTTAADDDGACTPSHCSLREAIAAANAAPNGPRRDEIRFAIPGVGPHTLLTAGLPALTDPVILDGYTQPGSSPNTQATGLGLNTVLGIELDLSQSGALIVSSASLVRGLAINRSGSAGIALQGSGGAVEGCFIGTDITGSIARPNDDGIFMGGGSGNHIGGRTPAARNLISGNLGSGIHTSTPSHTVQGNLIGTNRAGTGALGNQRHGIHLDGSEHLSSASQNVIGGLEVGSLNVIAASGGSGVRGQATCCASVGGASANRIQGNFIGRGVGGVSLPNGSGVAFSAFNANPTILSDNLIGGDTQAPAGNLIADNNGPGVSFSGGFGDRVEGNAILGNTGPGVSLGHGSISGNVISANTGAGMVIGPVHVRANATFDNAGLGIDVSGNGVTPNDAGDHDLVANFPVLSAAHSSGGSTTITGVADVSAPVTLDFYASPTADSSNHGEGKVYLGSASASPNVAFNVVLPVAVTPGWVISATATYGTVRTSEFSLDVVVTTP